MSSMTLSVADFIAIGTLMVAFCGPMLALQFKIKRNDLHHLDKKIDDVMEAIERVETKVGLVESKIDSHIHDHATGALR